MISTVKKTSPLAWVPTVYFAMGLPFVVLNMVSAVMFKDMGISDARIAFWTSLIMWPWTIKFLWSCSWSCTGRRSSGASGARC